MLELDKNYIAGLYLDEITLDVMPQEYIDAALEVKLRYDACAPRAGYNCVQDRRVKGGFYYRKAPQGQGVNALPPSKLERALARSQEQPTQRSGLSFLSKAAIGAGVAIGGLALTGAVVNAGRSSEPYQEPVRQKPEKAKTSYNAAAIGVAGVAATSVGAAVVGLGKKPKPQEVDETITPQQSAQAPKVQPSKSPSSADLLIYSGSQGQKIAIPEGANFTGWKLHLNFGNGGENVTQEAYDKLTALGVPFKVGKSGSQTGKDATVYVGDPKKAKAIAAELSQLKGLKPLKGTDAEGNDIELAPGIGARFNVGAGNPEFQQYGRKGGVDLVDDVQNRIFDPNKNKSEAEINAGLQKDWENGDKALRAKFGDLYAGMMDSPKTGKPETTPPVVKVEDPASSPAEKPNTAPAYIASKVSTLYGGQNTTRNGFEELDAIRGKKTLGAYSDEEIDNAIASNPIQKIQVKGKTYIRDLDKVSEGVLINEAVNLRKASSKVNTTEAPEVRRLLEARDRKIANLNKKKDPTPEEKEAVAKLDKAVEEMRTAISDREKEPVRSGKVRPEKKPQAEDLGGDSGEGGGKNVRGESSKVKKAAADRAKQQETPDIEPPVVARSEEQIAADRVATERAKQAKDQEAKQSKREGMAALTETRLTEKGIELSIKKQQKQIDGDEFNAEVEKLRQNPATVRAVEKAIEPIANEYDDRIAQVSNETKRKSLEKEKAAKVEEQTLETYRGLQIPDPLQVKPPAPTAEKAALDKKATNKGTPVGSFLTSNLPLELVSAKTPEYSGSEVKKLSEGIDNAKGTIPILATQTSPMGYESKSAISDLIVHAAKLANNELDSVRAYTFPEDKDTADAMLRQQDILYRSPSDIEPSLSQRKIKGQTSLTLSLDLDSLTPTKPVENYDPKTIDTLAKEFVKVGDTVKPIVTIQKDPLSHEIVDGHLQYYAAKKAAEINPQYANIRSYPAEDMNHAEAIVAQYEAVRKAIAETDAVKAAVAPKAVRSPSNKPAKESPTPPPTTPPVTPAPKAASEANAAAVSKLSKKEAPVNEEENGSSTPITPKVEDIAKIEGVYNSRIKDAESIGDKMLKANAIRNAFQDKERAIAALSNPPEPSVGSTTPSSSVSTPANKPVAEKKEKPSTPKPKEEKTPTPVASTQDLKKSLEQKAKAIAEGLNLTAEDGARYASISGSTVSAGTLKGNEMLGKINTRMSFLQDQKKADRIEALRDKANKGEFVSQSDIDAVSIDFDGNYSPSDLKSEQAKSDISRAVSRLRLSEDVGEKPERRAKRMLLEVAGLASDPERLTSYLSSPQNYSAFKAGTKDDLNTVDYMSSQEKSQLESLIKNTFNASAIAAYKRGENYSNKDLQRVYKDLTGKRLSFTAAQKKAADKAEQVNDAIAPSEIYLATYWETRNQYRRAS